MHLKYQSKKFDFSEDSNQHLWAVSYSDMLMLLISFFVIYFEIADAKKLDSSKYVDPLTRIILALKGGTNSIVDKKPEDKAQSESSAVLNAKGENLKEGNGTTAFVGNALNEATVGKDVESSTVGGVKAEGKPVGIFALVDILKKQNPKLNLKTNELMREVVVDFPEDSFTKGDFEVRSGLRKDLKLVLEKIIPFKDEVTLIFVGHSDTVPLRKKDGIRKIVDSNLILSNLRAGRAAEVALQMQFSPEFVSTQGMGEYSRNTRSLSLSIRAKTSNHSKEKGK